MNIFKLLFQLFLLYMLYKLVFDFIIPVYRASKKMQRDVNQMQEKMREQQRQQAVREEKAVNRTAGNPDRNTDYIEFEEVK